MKTRKNSLPGFITSFLLLTLSLTLFVPKGFTAIPQKINYQGYLTNASGVPVNGTIPMVFSIYNVTSGGATLWTETQNITVTKGVYNVVLGDVTPIALAFDVPYYLGIKVGADPEMTPRSPLTAVPYAFAATYALSAPPTWHQILPAAQRFVLVMNDQAVLDKETGLVWERSPDTSTYEWVPAQSRCNTLTLGNRKGWRLPTVQDLASLVDPSVPFPGPTLPAGHPFINVQSPIYWSATTFADLTTYAWVVAFDVGGVDRVNKSSYNFVWCTRGGQGVDAQ